eukprot:364635-Chlamydomonas_euryale.AAC.1
MLRGRRAVNATSASAAWPAVWGDAVTPPSVPDLSLPLSLPCVGLPRVPASSVLPSIASNLARRLVATLDSCPPAAPEAPAAALGGGGGARGGGHIAVPSPEAAPRRVATPSGPELLPLPTPTAAAPGAATGGAS